MYFTEYSHDIIHGSLGEIFFSIFVYKCIWSGGVEK